MELVSRMPQWIADWLWCDCLPVAEDFHHIIHRFLDWSGMDLQPGRTKQAASLVNTNRYKHLHTASLI